MTALPALQTLDQRMRAAQMDLVRRDGLVAFPYYWQVPAATEKAAYESIVALLHPPPFEYFGFPWASVIDGLRGDSAITATILMALRRACESPAGTRKRVTVAQHIHAMQFVELFQACGMTDVFWSHATHQQHEIEGIRLHPFPLFPAQTPDATPVGDLNRPRRYLANFIGAYNPKLYLTNVREVIFNDPNETGDLLVIKRELWHFDRAVYVEQMHGRPATDEQVRREREEAKEYLDTILQSWFTLCPTGSGPNSIRIYEALALGSIPIILTKTLRLPGSLALWEKATLIEEDSQDGYQRAISRARAMSNVERQRMIIAGAELYAYVGPASYAGLIGANFRILEEAL